ncbi:hypothetical protein SFC57_24130 [Niallia circulans]|uniref:hypothetical protein n=1 Tax=Bacillaceae TaxID=186817 RepID=UPI00397B7049
MKKTKQSHLKLGKEIYGTKNIELAFKEALKPYFNLQEPAKIGDWYNYNQSHNMLKYKYQCERNDNI